MKNNFKKEEIETLMCYFDISEEKAIALLEQIKFKEWKKILDLKNFNSNKNNNNGFLISVLIIAILTLIICFITKN